MANKTSLLSRLTQDPIGVLLWPLILLTVTFWLGYGITAAVLLAEWHATATLSPSLFPLSVAALCTLPLPITSAVILRLRRSHG